MIIVLHIGRIKYYQQDLHRQIAPAKFRRLAKGDRHVFSGIICGNVYRRKCRSGRRRNVNAREAGTTHHPMPGRGPCRKPGTWHARTVQVAENDRTTRSEQLSLFLKFSWISTDPPPIHRYFSPSGRPSAIAFRRFFSLSIQIHCAKGRGERSTVLTKPPGPDRHCGCSLRRSVPVACL